MSMRLRGLAVWVGLLLSAGARAEDVPAAAAATGAVAGVAIDSASGRPLVGALVQLTPADGPAPGAPATVLSEDGGKFALDGLPVGRYALSVKLDGYQPFARTDVAVKAGETARVGAWLTP